MSTIIAGRFDNQDHAERALEALQTAGFPLDAMSHFYVNPDGQHDIYPIGGDQRASPGARDAGKGAVAGAGAGAVAGAAIGAATTPVIGPAGIAIGAGLGAYTGSLVGAMTKTDKDSEVDEAEDAGEVSAREVRQHQVMERQAGTHVAVRVGDRPELSRERAIEVLRSTGAADVEQAEGQMVEGHWTDFDPRRVVDLV
ncbi:glycine zipper domain-containing protein [Pseudomonas sp.]|jgi:uncharacterized membrane protein|uniref:glycine zipper domain-containing protein n=1 Tax=Pseudomonas sp. TaxID=306 RepID=UPI00272ACDB5|nr:glycine zipper domain-containing protein [Pseudomonas sp.]